jgi:hypothetical protein
MFKNFLFKIIPVIFIAQVILCINMNLYSQIVDMDESLYSPKEGSERNKDNLKPLIDLVDGDRYEDIEDFFISNQLDQLNFDTYSHHDFFKVKKNIDALFIFIESVMKEKGRDWPIYLTTNQQFILLKIAIDNEKVNYLKELWRNDGKYSSAIETLIDKVSRENSDPSFRGQRLYLSVDHFKKLCQILSDKCGEILYFAKMTHNLLFQEIAKELLKYNTTKFLPYIINSYDQDSFSQLFYSLSLTERDNLFLSLFYLDDDENFLYTINTLAFRDIHNSKIEKLEDYLDLSKLKTLIGPFCLSSKNNKKLSHRCFEIFDLFMKENKIADINYELEILIHQFQIEPLSEKIKKSDAKNSNGTLYQGVFEDSRLVEGILIVQDIQIEKVKLYNKGDAVKEVIVGYGESKNTNNYAFILKLAHIIEQINKEDGLKLKLKVIEGLNMGNLRRKSYDLNQGLSFLEQRFSFLELIESDGNPNIIWGRDICLLGECYFRDSSNNLLKEKLIFDTHRKEHRSRNSPAHFIAQKFMGVHLLSDIEHNVSGNMGGNILVTPSDILIFGNTVTAKNRRILTQYYHQRNVEIDTRWLKVGHSDEIFMTVKDPDLKKNPCGQKIIYSSPAKALEIMSEEIKSINPITRELDGKIKFYTELMPEDSKDIMMKIEEDLKNHLSEKLSGPDPDNQKNKFNKYTKLNLQLVIEDIIQGNLRKIKEKIEKLNPLCKNLPVIPIPTLYNCHGLRMTYLGDTKIDNCYSAHPNSVNMEVIDQNLLMGDSMVPQFNSYNLSILKQNGLTPHLLNVNFYHELGGGLHCGTNTIREILD